MAPSWQSSLGLRDPVRLGSVSRPPITPIYWVPRGRDGSRYAFPLPCLAFAPFPFFPLAMPSLQLRRRRQSPPPASCPSQRGYRHGRPSGGPRRRAFRAPKHEQGVRPQAVRMAGKQPLSGTSNGRTSAAVGPLKRPFGSRRASSV